MDSRLRVLMFTPHLGGGGAERHMVRVANALDRRTFSVSFVVLRGGGAFEKDLAADVPVHILNTRMRGAVPGLARAIRDQGPDVVFSTMEHANCTAIAAANLARPRPSVVIGVQVAVTRELRSDVNVAKRALRLLVPVLYPRADRVVALSRGVRDDLLTWVPRLAARTQVIYNAGIDDTVARRAQESVSVPEAPPGESPVVVAVGRLTVQKGFTHLLDAMARVRTRVPARLWILGEGPLRGELEAKARALGIDEQVWFPGFVANPYAYMRHADVFALSSEWEGFANVITEAMEVGLPVVSTDCPYGPGEIIRSEAEGILVPTHDPAAMAVALERVLTDATLRRALSEAGRKRARDFSAPTIAAEYGRCFLAVASSRATLAA